MIAKPPSRKKYLLFFIAIASICLVTIAFGLYGSINLVREVSVSRPATAKALEFSTDIAISEQGTATAEAATASTATARDKWSRIFFDPFDSDERGDWPIGELGDSFTSVSTYFEVGKYFLEVSAGLPVNWQVWSNVYVGSEFELKVDVKSHDALSDASYGVAFREKFGDFYAFLINDDQLYRVGLIKDGNWDSLFKLSRSAAIKPGEINTLKVEAYGSHLFFFINDELVGDLIDNSLMSGRAGLCVDLPTGQNSVIVFDNLTLSAPPD